MRNDGDWSSRQTTWSLSFRILPRIRNDARNRHGGKMQNAENTNNEARLRCWSGTHIAKHFDNVLGLRLSLLTLQKFLLILHDIFY